MDKIAKRKYKVFYKDNLIDTFETLGSISAMMDYDDAVREAHRNLFIIEEEDEV